MPAAFLAHLIFQMHGGHAGADHGFDGAGDVEGAAPACVDVDQKRRLGGPSDAAGIFKHIVQGRHAKVGQAV